MRACAGVPRAQHGPARGPRNPMSAPLLEAFLARLYTDAEFRACVLADPLGEAARAGLDPDECAAIAAIDRVGLDSAAESYARKRERQPPPATWRARLSRLLRRAGRF